MDKFFSNFSTEQIGQRPVFVGIDGGEAFQNITGFDFNTESNLDLQC